MNQAGEDNRNVARMALLLAGMPQTVPGMTVNRLCASGLDAVIAGARAIASGDAELIVAGGVETHEPLALRHGQGRAPPSPAPPEIYDTTIGWRFVNPAMKKQYGVDAMPETAENVATDYQISREDQDAFAAAQPSPRAAPRAPRASSMARSRRSRSRTAKGDIGVAQDEHPARTPRSRRCQS